MKANLLERAIALAAVAHAGAKDKGDAPYILHPLRVMLNVTGETQQIAAVLHDIVEDTPVTLDQLRELGFSEEVIAAVTALTKAPGDENNYFGFVERVGQSAIARPVKLADIEDNMDRSRISTPSARDEERLARYRRARKLLQLIGRERGESACHAPTIMPLKGGISPRDIEAECPGTRPIHVCDFHVAGAELGNEVSGSLQLGRLLNVDHHAPLARMESHVTSTRLACDYLEGRPPHEPAAWVVINHTDCDSVLSSALLMGAIEPTDRLVRAAECADHTGERNNVADLLQGLDEPRRGNRTGKQYCESLRNLRLLLAGEELEPAALDALRKREEKRAQARRAVDAGTFSIDGCVALGVLEEEIDGSFFPPLLKDAAVIMLATPCDGATAGHWNVKLRLGRAAPPGMTLHSLEISQWDSNFGGRWNAGGNKRGKGDKSSLGGTTMAPEAYAARLREAVAKAPIARSCGSSDADGIPSVPRSSSHA